MPTDNTPIVGTIIPDPAKLVREILHFLPECCDSFYVTSWKYDECLFKLVGKEEDEGAEYELNEEKAVKGLRHLVQQIADNKLFFSGLSIENIDDPCNWDLESTDALVQAALLGEVIYG